MGGRWLANPVTVEMTDEHTERPCVRSYLHRLFVVGVCAATRRRVMTVRLSTRTRWALWFAWCLAFIVGGVLVKGVDSMLLNIVWVIVLTIGFQTIRGLKKELEPLDRPTEDAQ